MKPNGSDKANLAIVGLVTLLAAAQASDAQEKRMSELDSENSPITIQWSRLAPEDGKPFSDPFSKLTRDQLSDLSYVARVGRLIYEEKIDSNGADANEAAKMSAKLQQQGVDIGWLLVQRERIPQVRKQQIKLVSEAVAQSLKSNIVAIDGYAIPIREQAGLVVEILVVPTAATCSHATESSPLRVISVRNDEGFSLRQKGTPVRVSGVLSAEAQSTRLVTPIGVQSFVSAYKIAPSKLEIRITHRTPKTVEQAPATSPKTINTRIGE